MGTCFSGGHHDDAAEDDTGGGGGAQLWAPPPLKRHWRHQITAREAEGAGDLPEWKRLDGWKEALERGRRRKRARDGGDADAREDADRDGTPEELRKEEEEAAKRRARRRALVERLLGSVSAAVAAKLTSMSLEFGAKLIELVEDAVRERGDVEGAELANAIGALACTFRFENKGERKMAIIRREMVAPCLIARARRLTDRDGVSADALAEAVSAKVGEIVRTSETVQRAVAHVAGLPVIALLRERAALAAGEGPDGGALLVAAAALQRKLEEGVRELVGGGPADGAGAADAMALVVSVGIAAVQRKISSAAVIGAVSEHTAMVLRAAFAGAAMGGAAAAEGTGSERPCADAEARYVAAKAAIRARVDEAMALVKACLLGQEGEEDENEGDE